MKSDFEISDGRIKIRPCRLKDADAIYAAVCDSKLELSKWVPWCHPDYSKDECALWLSSRSLAWSEGKEFDFVILDAYDDSFLGCCGLYDINPIHNFVSLGYWVRTDRSCKGVASAAVRLVAKFGFEVLKFTRLEIVVAVANKASQRVAVKAGCMREGVLRNRHRVHDNFYDAIMFSLLPGDMGTSRPVFAHVDPLA